MRKKCDGEPKGSHGLYAEDVSAFFRGKLLNPLIHLWVTCYITEKFAGRGILSICFLGGQSDMAAL